MRLKLSSPPPIGGNVNSNALGETPLYWSPVVSGPVAALTTRSRSRKLTSRDPNENLRCRVAPRPGSAHHQTAVGSDRDCAGAVTGRA